MNSRIFVATQRKKCKEKRIELFVANNVKLLKDIKADGIYISANNFSLNYSQIKKSNFNIPMSYPMGQLRTKLALEL